MNQKQLVVVLALSLSLVDCSAKTAGDPSLTLTLSSSKPASGAPFTAKVAALNGDGTIGVGTVHVMATAGSLAGTGAADATLDGFGTATVTLSCDIASDSKCASTVAVTASWTPATGTVARATATFTAIATGTGGGSATGGGVATGGGAATGGGPAMDGGADAGFIWETTSFYPGAGDGVLASGDYVTVIREATAGSGSFKEYVVSLSKQDGHELWRHLITPDALKGSCEALFVSARGFYTKRLYDSDAGLGLMNYIAEWSGDGGLLWEVEIPPANSIVGFDSQGAVYTRFDRVTSAGRTNWMQGFTYLNNVGFSNVAVGSTSALVYGDRGLNQVLISMNLDGGLRWERVGALGSPKLWPLDGDDMLVSFVGNGGPDAGCLDSAQGTALLDGTGHCRWVRPELAQGYSEYGPDELVLVTNTTSVRVARDGGATLTPLGGLDSYIVSRYATTAYQTVITGAGSLKVQRVR